MMEQMDPNYDPVRAPRRARKPSTWQRLQGQALAWLSGALKRAQRRLTYGLDLHLGSYHLYWDPVRGRDLRWVYITNDREEVIHRMLMTLGEVHNVSKRGSVKVEGHTLLVTGVSAVVTDPEDPAKSAGLPMAVIRVAAPKIPEVYVAETFTSWDDFEAQYGRWMERP